jgi:hypothetical protein
VIVDLNIEFASELDLTVSAFGRRGEEYAVNIFNAWANNGYATSLTFFKEDGLLQGVVVWFIDDQAHKCCVHILAIPIDFDFLDEIRHEL